MLKYIKNGMAVYEPQLNANPPANSIILRDVYPENIDRRFQHVDVNSKEGHEQDGKWMHVATDTMAGIDVLGAGCKPGSTYTVKAYLVELLSDVTCTIVDGEVLPDLDQLKANMEKAMRAEVTEACGKHTKSVLASGDTNAHWDALYALCSAKVRTEYITAMLEAEIFGTDYTVDGYADWVVNTYERYNITQAKLRNAGTRARAQLNTSSFSTLDATYVAAATQLTNDLQTLGE